MVQKTQKRGGNMADWGAANLQFAWFVADTAPLNPTEIFTLLAGSEPESVQSSKIPRPNNPFLGVAEAQIESIQHRLTIQPGRVDYFLQSVVETEIGPALIEKPLTLISPVADRIRKFEVAALRLAFVVNMLKLETSLAAASQTINELAGKPFPFDDATDIALQVNRPKSVNNIQINRLLRYSTGMFQSVQFQMNPGIAQSAPPVTHGFAANAIGDFNTVPIESLFKAAELSPIWDVLIAEASKFVGDRSIGVLD